MGDVIGDLNSRRGLVGEFIDKPGGMKLIKARLLEVSIPVHKLAMAGPRVCSSFNRTPCGLSKVQNSSRTKRCLLVQSDSVTALLLLPHNTP